MAKSVSTDGLAVTIVQSLKAYTDDVTKGIEKEVKDTTKKIKDGIKADSPRDTGDYAKGWSQKKDGKGGQLSYTIYNKNKPSLTHLLEKGFTRRNGKRQSGIPHIRINYDQYADGLPGRIAKIIKEGG